METQYNLESHDNQDRFERKNLGKCIMRNVLDLDDSGKIMINVPEWEGYCWVRIMSGAERIRFVKTIGNTKDGEIPEGMAEDLIIATVIGDDDKPIFLPGDRQRLSQKSSVVLDRLFQASAKLNGLLSSSIEERVGE